MQLWLQKLKYLTPLIQGAGFPWQGGFPKLSHLIFVMHLRALIKFAVKGGG